MNTTQTLAASALDLDRTSTARKNQRQFSGREDATSPSRTENTAPTRAGTMVRPNSAQSAEEGAIARLRERIASDRPPAAGAAGAAGAAIRMPPGMTSAAGGGTARRRSGGGQPVEQEGVLGHDRHTERLHTACPQGEGYTRGGQDWQRQDAGLPRAAPREAVPAAVHARRRAGGGRPLADARAGRADLPGPEVDRDVPQFLRGSARGSWPMRQIDSTSDKPDSRFPLCSCRQEGVRTRAAPRATHEHRRGHARPAPPAPRADVGVRGRPGLPPGPRRGRPDTRPRLPGADGADTRLPPPGQRRRGDERRRGLREADDAFLGDADEEGRGPGRAEPAQAGVPGRARQGDVEDAQEP
ncbi:hypothetical protein THAOC_32167 [Thalassiosira oceanica]|uniref:Uncharacterized protein n=1 Tax=Thalassiosira oceanica TaxID=159749 RepID=K0R9S5_THAOC|nr:hypothetical protein THAOC_32167 [Thalassiosira oceanica]|eukprot:EJK48994.1 hypothetical protein THAOC_32167 [Thalassiosira oceanica]